MNQFGFVSDSCLKLMFMSPHHFNACRSRYVSIRSSLMVSDVLKKLDAEKKIPDIYLSAACTSPSQLTFHIPANHDDLKPIIRLINVEDRMLLQTQHTPRGHPPRCLCLFGETSSIRFKSNNNSLVNCKNKKRALILQSH